MVSCCIARVGSVQVIHILELRQMILVLDWTGSGSAMSDWFSFSDDSFFNFVSDPTCEDLLKDVSVDAIKLQGKEECAFGAWHILVRISQSLLLWLATPQPLFKFSATSVEFSFKISSHLKEFVITMYANDSSPITDVQTTDKIGLLDSWDLGCICALCLVAQDWT